MGKATETETGKNDRSDQVLIDYAIGATTVFVLAAFVLAFSKGIWTLELNEIGDFIAGFASLLAFMWLIITIMLQYRELKLQRLDHEKQLKIYEDQKDAMEGSLKAAKEEVELTRKNQVLMLTEFLEQRRDKVVHGLLAQLIYDVIPALCHAPAYAAQKSLTDENYVNAKRLLEGRRYPEALNALGIFLLNEPSNLEQIKKEFQDVPFLRERLETLSMVLMSAKTENERSEVPILDIGLFIVEKGLGWLLDCRTDLPNATDKFKKQLEEAMAESDEMGKNFEEFKQLRSDERS